MNGLEYFRGYQTTTKICCLQRKATRISISVIKIVIIRSYHDSTRGFKILTRGLGNVKTLKLNRCARVLHLFTRVTGPLNKGRLTSWV